MIFIKLLFLQIVTCDAAEPWQLGSQDAATPMMQGIIDLHHDIFFFLLLILVFVLWILVRALWHFHEKRNPTPQRIVHGTTIEILRTIFPSIILMFRKNSVSRLLATIYQHKGAKLFHFLWSRLCPQKYNLQATIMALYYRSPMLQKSLQMGKYFLFFLFFAKTNIIICSNLYGLLCQSTFLGILPSEYQLLEHYLRQPHQDQDWVEFVRIRLQTHGLSPAAYDRMFRDFMNTELCFSVREKILDIFTFIFYGGPDPQLWINPRDLRYIIEGHLETRNLEFELSSLCQILESLCYQRQESPFYTDVQSAQAQHFQGFLNQYRHLQGQILEREAFLQKSQDLSIHSDFLSKENALLKEKILLIKDKDTSNF